MIPNRSRTGTPGAISREEPPEEEQLSAWASGIPSESLLSTRTLAETVAHMRGKPAGYYVFTRPEDAEGSTYTVLVQQPDETVRYEIRPSEDYRAYVVSTLEGDERRYGSICELLGTLCEAHEDYAMIQDLEKKGVPWGPAGPGALEAHGGGRRRPAPRRGVDEISSMLGEANLSCCECGRYEDEPCEDYCCSENDRNEDECAAPDLVEDEEDLGEYDYSEGETLGDDLCEDECGESGIYEDDLCEDDRGEFDRSTHGLREDRVEATTEFSVIGKSRDDP